IVADRYQSPALRGEDHAFQVLLTHLASHYFLFSLHVPDTEERSVNTCQQAAIRREADDARVGKRMIAPQGSLQFASVRIPQLNRRVKASRRAKGKNGREQAAIRVVGHSARRECIVGSRPAPPT